MRFRSAGNYLCALFFFSLWLFALRFFSFSLEKYRKDNIIQQQKIENGGRP